MLVQQPEKPPDPKELAVVQKIRARIEEKGRAAAAGPPAAYKVTIPNTIVTYGMAPVPAGEFLMGSAAAGDAQPQHKVRLDAFWMQTHEVTWDSYLLFMFADQAKETDHPDAIVDALPQTATLSDVVDALQARQVDAVERRELAAQEADPESPLNVALAKAARALDAGLGISHSDVVRRFRSPA